MNKTRLGAYYEWQDSLNKPATLSQHLEQATTSLRLAKGLLPYSNKGGRDTLTEAICLIDNVMED